jgi:hypothetical protein
MIERPFWISGKKRPGKKHPLSGSQAMMTAAREYGKLD